jgi:uroporphyrinogen-III synthase
MRLIITRPAEDAERQAAQIRALGHEPLIYPLMEVLYQQVTPLQLDGVQALIATSRNALRGLSRNSAFADAKLLPVYCVGDSTADYARELGFIYVFSGEGTAQDLLKLISHALHPESGALLYLTGHHLAFDLETPLKSLGFLVPRVILYETREIAVAGAHPIIEALKEGADGVILMSPRTSTIFAGLVKKFNLEGEDGGITCYCYSDAIAKPLREINGLTIEVSSHPTEADLMELIGTAPPQIAALAELKEVLGKL